MSQLGIALVLLAFVFGGALFGLWLQRALPDQHLSNETKDVVRLSSALIATISALVLGLLVSSAKSSFDRFDDELTQNAARVIMLDRALDEYGPQTSDIRAALKSGYARSIEQLFSADSAVRNAGDGALAVTQEETIDVKLLALTPSGPVQEGLYARAVALNYDINLTKALLHAQREDSIPSALLIVVGAWLALIFATFGLFAPRNGVVVAAFLACALSASGAVLLTLEMNSPFTGLITLSSAPMQEALRYLGN
jgi:hypothetical protein